MRCNTIYIAHSYYQNDTRIQRQIHYLSKDKKFGKFIVYFSILGSLSAPIYCLMLVFYITLRRPKVVVANDFTSSLISTLLLPLFGYKQYVDFHEEIISRFKNKLIRNIIFKLVKIILNNSSHVTVASVWRQKIIRRYYGYKDARVLRNSSLIYLEQNSFEYLDKRKKIKKIKIKKHMNDQIKFVYIGGLISGRNLEEIIFNISNKKNISLDIIGRGKLYNRLSKICSSIKNVSVYSDIPPNEIVQTLCKYDFGIIHLDQNDINNITSDSNKLYEYLSAGLSIISTNTFQKKRLELDGLPIHGIEVIESKNLHAILHEYNSKTVEKFLKETYDKDLIELQIIRSKF